MQIEKLQSKTKTIAVTGLSGVIGDILIKELPLGIKVVDLFHKKKYSKSARITQHIQLDLLDKKNIQNALEAAKPEVVVHLAAITHIDKCEEDKANGREGIVWKTNVEGTKEIAKFCAKNKIPLIFTSTECVFDGNKDYFSELAKKNPINWYGTTKHEAEERILDSGARSTIIRSVVAYHENDNEKTILGKFLRQIRSGKNIHAVSNQYFTPTYTYDITRAIEKVIYNKIFGVLHVAPKNRITPYDFACLVAMKYNLPESIILKTTLEELYGYSRASLRLRSACLIGNKSNAILKMKPQNANIILDPKHRNKK